MSSRQSTTFVLVPGSFVTPGEYDKIVNLLEAQGHKVRPVGLASVNDGSRMPPATFDDDVAEIRSAVVDILDNEKRNVVLVLHSYSGIPGSSAMQGLSKNDRKSAGHSTAVTALVYMASFLPVLNESLRDIMWDYMPEAYRAGVPGGYLPAAAIEFAPFVFNDVPDQAEVAKYFGAMQRHASDSYSGKATYEAWKDIDSVQIIPQIDTIVPPPAQESMYERSVKQGGKVRKVPVEGAGHCINVSQPELVVREILAAAGQASQAGSRSTDAKASQL